MNNAGEEKQDTRPCFVVFSDDWGEHPSSCQHIFRYIARKHKVLWVNTIGMRNPRFSLRDARKVILKVGKMLRFDKRDHTGNAGEPPVTVCQPVMLPYSNFSIIRAINKFLVVSSVRRQLLKLHMRSPVIVSTVPNACDFVAELPGERIVYYCVDDFSEWPGLEKQLVLDMEKDLIGKTDCFIATSDKLYDKLKTYGKPTYLLTHGVDLEFFQQRVVREHALLDGIPRPRIGYYGLFDDRTDQAMLAEAARKLPNVSFVITGQVETDIATLEQLPNVYFTGPVSYRELPAMLKGWDACMLFYKINELTNAIQPLKLKEYLAARKPVFATPIAEAVAMEDYVTICPDSDSFKSKFIFNIYEKKTVNKVNNDFLRKESWEIKSLLFEKFILS